LNKEKDSTLKKTIQINESNPHQKLVLFLLFALKARILNSNPEKNELNKYSNKRKMGEPEPAVI
jgi:hypothetical protein